jgi:putative MATE family efflux protein
LGVTGAAVATVTAQLAVTVLFIVHIRNRKEAYFRLNIFRSPSLHHIRKIIRLGMPVSLQNGFFAMIAMVVARIIAVYGPEAIAVQKVGSQIESLSWMTAGGFSTALSAFVGQNYGAKEYDRIVKGYRSGVLAVSGLGFLSMIMLMVFPKQLFGIFIQEPETIRMGASYLWILGLSQVFMSIEISNQGAFNGLGRTKIPSYVGIFFNALRIPGAYLLSTYSTLGLDGVWWTISISSVFKGLVLFALFRIMVLKPYRASGTIR